MIPIAAFVSIDAGTASSSPFQRATGKSFTITLESPVHVPLESAFTMRWKPRSLCAGICTCGLEASLTADNRPRNVGVNQSGGADGLCGAGER